MKGNPLQTIPDLLHRYVVPAAPPMAWSAAPTRRRSRVGLAALAGILLVQGLLSLRLMNTAYQDEALYLYAGHMYLDLWFGDGAKPPQGFLDIFSGAPYLYPVAAALVDSVFGLAGARFVSLLCMAGVTALIYSLTVRLFNVRAALAAAAAYAVIEATTYMGNFATFDAPALLFITVAFWLVVRFDRRPSWPLMIIVPFLLSLAFAVKYAAAMFAGPVVALAVVVAWPYRGAVRSLLRGVGLFAMTGVFIGLWVAFGGFLQGLRFTTIDREINTDASAAWVLRLAAEYGGVFLLMALLGGVLYLRSQRLNEVPLAQRGPEGAVSPGKVWRFFLAAGLFSSGLLVPAYQAYIHTQVALHKHLGFGLMFAAPLVGVGLVRLMGRHFSSPQFAIAAWLLLLVPGMQQSEKLFYGWPDSTMLMKLVDAELEPDDLYLSSVPQVQQYYLGDRTTLEQWVSTYDLLDPFLQEKYLKYVEQTRFDMIMLDDQVEPEVNKKIQDTVEANPKYRLRARFYYGQGELFGNYMIWVKLP
ncbi:ArnT family glycosyltransferase [Actinocorallia aurantiaca]|uniref:DUF3824 domain-containing protein n=1 Tax=Actinocorallia aurantiaca TaxID=46204 RepID=A0ABN3UCG4_9ACTN